MPEGRPSEYTTEMLEKAFWYVNDGWKEAGDMVPSIAGLACELGLSRETLRRWGKDETLEFCGILELLRAKQERALVAGGLSNNFSGTISKLMLHKHGYSDKVEQDNKSSDGSMTPKVIERVIVNPDAKGK